MNYMQRNQDSSAEDIQVYSIQDQPEDMVSDLQWAPNNEFVFAVSSWDGKISIYQLQEPQHCLQKIMFFQYNEPVIKISWMDDASVIFAASADNRIIAIQLRTQQMANFGQHQGIISGIFWVSQLQCLVSFGYDKLILFWNHSGQIQKTITTKFPIHSVDISFPVCIFSYQDRYFSLNLQHLDRTISYDSMSSVSDSNIINVHLLGVQIRIHRQVSKVLFATDDSRVNLTEISKSYTSMDYKFTNVMTFKCQKKDTDNEIIVFPVNAIGFVDIKEGILFTAGGDNSLTFWNYLTKVKCREMEFNNPVVCSQINNKGNLMAYVIGYDWSQGIWGLEKAQRNKVFVHQLNNNDLISKEQIGGSAYNNTFTMR